MDIKAELIRRVEALSPEQQRDVLAYCESVQGEHARGAGGSALLRFSGVLDDVSASEMTRAIEDGCETVNIGDW